MIVEELIEILKKEDPKSDVVLSRYKHFGNMVHIGIIDRTDLGKEKEFDEDAGCFLPTKKADHKTVILYPKID